MEKNKFYVVIPSRERAETLKLTLDTCISQEYANVEFIVSDNCSKDNTAEIVSSYMKIDPRVRYVKPNVRLGMSEHWEFALDNIEKEGYVIIIGDDDALFPDALQTANLILSTNGDIQAFNWPTCYYHYSDLDDDASKNTLLLTAGALVSIRESKHWLKKVVENRAIYNQLPGIYHSCVHSSILQKIKSKNGRLINSLSPDIYLALAISTCVDKYLHYSKPLSLNAISNKSTGHTSVPGSDQSEVAAFFNESNVLKQHHLVPETPDIHVGLGDSILQAIDVGILNDNYKPNWERIICRALITAEAIPSKSDKLRRVDKLRELAKNINVSFPEGATVKEGLINVSKVYGDVSLVFDSPSFAFSENLDSYGISDLPNAVSFASKTLPQLAIKGWQSIECIIPLIETKLRMGDVSEALSDIKTIDSLFNGILGGSLKDPQRFYENCSVGLNDISDFDGIENYLFLKGICENMEQLNDKNSLLNIAMKLENQRGISLQKKIKIGLVIVEPKYNACPEIRLIRILNALKGDLEYKFIVENNGESLSYSDENLTWADLIIIQRTAPASLSREQLKAILSSKNPVIYEIDDFLITDLPKSNPNSAYMKQCSPFMRDFLYKADMVSVSTKKLAVELGGYNENITILPNLIDDSLWGVLPPRVREKEVTILYAGTGTHRDDLKIVEAALVKIHKKYSEIIRFVFLGCITDKLLKLPGVEFICEVNYSNYIKNIQNINADIAIAPLLESTFNNSKSNIKWLEYSISGIAGVYSDIAPYQNIKNGETGFLVDAKSSSWFETIEKLILDSELRLKIATAAKQDAINNYSISSAKGVYLDFWRNSLDMDRGIIEKRILQNKNTSYQAWLDKQKEYALIYSAEFLSDKNQNTKIHCLIYIDSEDLSPLANTIDSFSVQTYSNWHLSVISPNACPDEMFNEVAELSWIQFEQSVSLGALLSEIAVEAEWFFFLEAGDSLEPYAFASCIQYIDQNDSWDIVYTDHDKLSEEGFHHSPNFKPNFNLDLLYSMDYIGGLCLFKLNALTELDEVTYPNPFVGYGLVLNHIERCHESTIGHIDSILLHRPDTVEDFLVEHLEFRELTLAHHFKRKDIAASISKSPIEGVLDVKYPHTETSKVSIIIPTKDQLPILKACVDSILETTSYSGYEIIIIDNQSEERETKDYFDEITKHNPNVVRVIEYNKPYNYSAINNFAVEQAKGDYLVLLNNDTMVLQEEWLQGMLSHLQREKVGVVGVKLLYPNKTVQHAGVILGMGANGVAEHPHIGLPMGDAGYMNRAVVTQNVSAVTAACLMIEKSLYQQVGGLDEEKFKILYNDVDLCLKVRESGKKIVWTPYVSLIHHGSSSLKKRKQNKKRLEQTQQEIDNMLEKWLPQLSNDPAYNRNLSLKTTDFELDTAINISWNVDIKDKPRVYAFPMDSFGVGQYRVRAPVNALTRENIIESGLANNFDSLIYPTPTEIERIKPDVLLGQNLFLENMLTPWKRYKKFNSVFMVAGLDDLVYTLPSLHPKKKDWSGNVRKNVKEFFQYSDRVVVANDALADEFKKLTSNEIIVVPNYLENWRWQSLNLPEKSVTKKIRVGWAGGQEHEADLQFIIPIIKALHKEVDWVFMGSCLEEMKPYVKEVHGGVEFDLYPQKLADLNLDLAIAPLMHNKFNECKTNLRLLEFGIMSWPIVCSDILPYQNAPVTRVANSTNEWIRVIREKINEPSELLKEGAELRQWVVDNYMLDDHLDEWVAALLPN